MPLGFLLEVELDCLFPELAGGRARDAKQAGGVVKAEVNASKNRI